jgi:hypothetical protein
MKQPFPMAFGAALLLCSPAALAQEPPPALPGLVAPVAPPAPAEPPTVPVKVRRRSTPMMIAGMVVTSFGMAALVGATATFASIHSCKPGCDDDLDSILKLVVGAALAGVGSVHVIVGTPLWVTGARPAGPEAPAKDPLQAAPPATARTGSGLTLRWTF